MAGVYRAKTRLAETEALAKRAIEIGPNNPSGYTFLAAIRTDAGLNEEAVALCEKAVELAPNGFAALAALAWILPRTGDLKRSIAVFTRAHQARPTPSGALIANHAFVTHLAGQHEHAIELYKQSKVSTGILDTHVRLAAVCADLGRLDDARARNFHCS